MAIPECFMAIIIGEYFSGSPAKSNDLIYSSVISKPVPFNLCAVYMWDTLDVMDSQFSSLIEINVRSKLIFRWYPKSSNNCFSLFHTSVTVVSLLICTYNEQSIVITSFALAFFISARFQCQCLQATEKYLSQTPNHRNFHALSVLSHSLDSLA